MGDDGAIIVFQQLGTMMRFSRLLIEGTFAFHDIWRDEQSNAAVGDTPFLGLLGVALVVHDMVIEETCLLCTRMSNQGLFLGHFELERLLQEVPQLLFNFLSFRSRTSKAKKRIVGLPNIGEASIGLIVGINGGKFLALLVQRFCFLSLPSSPHPLLLSP
jgi:hypothetical protein